MQPAGQMSLMQKSLQPACWVQQPLSALAFFLSFPFWHYSQSMMNNLEGKPVLGRDGRLNPKIGSSGNHPLLHIT